MITNIKIVLAFIGISILSTAVVGLITWFVGKPERNQTTLRRLTRKPKVERWNFEKKSHRIIFICTLIWDFFVIFLSFMIAYVSPAGTIIWFTISIAMGKLAYFYLDQYLESIGVDKDYKPYGHNFNTISKYDNYYEPKNSNIIVNEQSSKINSDNTNQLSENIGIMDELSTDFDKSIDELLDFKEV